MPIALVEDALSGCPGDADGSLGLLIGTLEPPLEGDGANLPASLPSQTADSVGKRPSIGGPRHVIVNFAVRRQPPGSATGGRHHEDVTPAPPQVELNIRDPLTIGR